MTLIPDRAYKQPSEEEYLAVDFSKRLGVGDALKLIIDYKCWDGDIDVTSSIIKDPIIDGDSLKFWFINGTDGKTYTFTIKVETDFGAKLEEDLKLKVQEVGHA